ncbi:NADH-quinone oxidoreductase subunit C [Rhodohalobacter sulfatireducens]|nr:NADH-quinone oxidoreductase subunit C [Rhodohalobacter sulfatireducens]MDR9365705.1 NADH-quinone oxidoreductase subunit C [Balneolaceae bacterium]MDR9407830.1 NADH-quinone oxidoreductase subunit C [Balneolaceae bacterium]
MKLPEEIFNYLRENNEEAGLEYQTGDIGEPWILVEASSLKPVMKTLRDDPQLLFDVLMCLSGVHYQKEEELGVTYHINSTSLGHKLAIKVRVPIDNPHVPSVESIWKTANWHEREAWDMVGVIFDEHPNHKRILCPEDWEGHPLRKDYVQQEFYQGMPTGE